MKTTIFYLSATGNSLSIANKLKDGLENVQLVPIMNTLEESYEFEPTERIGFVFPLHYQGIPIPLKKLIEKNVIKGVKYIFAVITRGTPPTGGAIAQLKSLLKEQSLNLNSGFYVHMPGCDITSFFDVVSKEKEKIILMKSERRIQEINRLISQIKDVEDAEPLKFLRLIRYPYFLSRIRKTPHYFWTSEHCKKCGACEKACLMNNISLDHGRPKWGGNCVECEACINYCPEKAIQYKKTTLKKGRYQHQDFTLNDLIKQKGTVL